MPSRTCNAHYGQAQVRVSCGHLCEAEAPTEPVGEIYLPLHFFIQIIICRGDKKPIRSLFEVRVSGGDLCEAEAPTEPAGET